MTLPLRKFMNVEQASDYLGVSESLLNKMRTLGDGPAFLKIGARVQYDVKDLERFAGSKRRHSTSELATTA